MISAAIYVRISSDPRGEGLGVARQEADCRALAARLGWTVGGVYADNDISAYRGKVRPAYERLLADIGAGRVRALLAWHTDRLHRSPRELERFVDLAERTGLQVQTVQAGKLDLATASGRMVARMLGAAARYESEHKADRIRSKLAEVASAGRPHGGHRPYGWEPNRMTIREDEAAVIREACGRVLNGEPIRAIIRDLNGREVRSATGLAWTHPTFRKMLMHGRHAGLREHNGREIPAAWPAIVPVETLRAVRRVLDDPGRVTTPGRGGRLHLLSGIAVCAVCGASLRVNQSKGMEAYRCKASGCVSRRRDRMEEFITDVVIARLSRSDAADLLAPEDDGGARAQAAADAERVRQRMDEAADSFAAGAITGRQLETITARLRPQLAALEEAAAPPPDRASVLGDVVGSGDVAAAWAALTPDVRRMVVRLLMEIRVHRGRRGPGFKSEGIEVVWRR
ncbi:recombinase family protein [Micromonospora aurantiaca]|uniref:recombinase family protein n=1 Tax=Micromonospora aurantiaca (nom. illeg.) TaxID=47850 RepID=UPI003787E6D3